MSEWLQDPYAPVEVSDVLMAFPGDVRHLMPAWEDIPEAFKDGRSDWARLQHRWFAEGLPEDAQFHLYKGIDGNTAVRHLRCIQGSFQPKHEHKVAAVAYLMSLWFGGVRIGEDEYGDAFLDA